MQQQNQLPGHSVPGLNRIRDGYIVMFPSRIRLHLSVCAVGSLLRPRSDSTVVVSRGLSVSTQHGSVREYRFF